ncbi:MAG: hypothetical protein WCG06_02535, partial [Candidatus Omnitrophota bacterium]
MLDYDPSRSLYYLHTYLELPPQKKVAYKVKVNDVWTIAKEEISFLRGQAEQHLTSLEDKENYEMAKRLADKIYQSLDEIETTQQEQMLEVEKRMETYRVNMQRIKSIRSYVILLKDFEQEAELEADTVKLQKSIKYLVKAVNPSKTKSMNQEVIRYLPVGISPDLVSDRQGFDLKYDAEKKMFYLSKKVELAPEETKTFDVRVIDRWFVREDKLNAFETEAQELTDFLMGSEFKIAAVYLNNEIKKYSKEIKGAQSAEVSIQDRIGNFTENVKKVEAIKIDLAELQRMAQIMRERTRTKTLEELLKKLRPSTLILWRIIYGTITFLLIISILTYALWWGQAKQKQVKNYKDLDK